MGPTGVWSGSQSMVPPWVSWSCAEAALVGARAALQVLELPRALRSSVAVEGAAEARPRIWSGLGRTGRRDRRT